MKVSLFDKVTYHVSMMVNGSTNPANSIRLSELNNYVEAITLQLSGSNLKYSAGSNYYALSFFSSLHCYVHVIG